MYFAGAAYNGYHDGIRARLRLFSLPGRVPARGTRPQERGKAKMRMLLHTHRKVRMWVWVPAGLTALAALAQLVAALMAIGHR